MRQLWQQGFTKTKAMQDCDNVGAYFSAYLGDMPLDEVQALPPEEMKKSLAGSVTIEEKQFTDDEGLTKDKKFVKGGRLYLYPPGMNIVRKTKGIRLPEVEYMSRSEAEKRSARQSKPFPRLMKFLMMVEPLSM